ncbi:ZIP family metal transporter [Ideonella sp. A 288]|uniref:ZIP family metal transporter n=1 Tax=Ideonella sp. A 288 TaxID=1962181 RepID=UPI000B4B5609|nr:ZIP family metal transporter [Ideonella sp. A 288]
MTLSYIIMATLAGGMLSVLIAASLTVATMKVLCHGLVSVSAGLLMGTALLHLLPEAFESAADPHSLFLALLGGLLFFFLLEKAELYRHSHEHDPPTAAIASRGTWSVLLGDSIHNLCDGIIIAAAFLTDFRLGITTSIAIIVHEIPQEVGDYVVLLSLGLSRRRALFYNLISGLASVVGGILGYLIVAPWQAVFPYLLVVASSSFLYVAVADLLPSLQRRLPWRQTAMQLGWLASGPAVVLMARSFAHAGT